MGILAGICVFIKASYFALQRSPLIQEPSLLTTPFFILQIWCSASGGVKLQESYPLRNAWFSNFHSVEWMQNCPTPHQYSELREVKKLKRKAIEFVEHAIYLLVQLFL